MIYAILLFIGFTTFDQLTKYIANNLLTVSKPIDIIPQVLRFDLVFNDGAAYGMFSGSKVFLLLITFLATLVFSAMLYYSNFKTKKIYSLSITLILSGTVGNFIDRMIFGSVTDFINFPFLKFLGQIGTFTANVADIYLTFGLILLFIDLLFFMGKRDKLKKEKEKNENNSTITKEA